VKGPAEASFACSEYDKIILIFRDGLYKVINVVDKLFVGHEVMYAGKVDNKVIFNLIYREGREGLSYVKRCHMPKFILEKEYRFFPEHPGSRIQYLATGTESRVRAYFVPSHRAKVGSVEIIFNEYLVKGAPAIGKRLGNRGLRRIVPLVDKEVEPTENPQPTLPGLAAVSPAPGAETSAGPATPADPETDEAPGTTPES
jgi:topoisomerase-4 subunit A